jgi:serine/threonine protein kinase
MVMTSSFLGRTIAGRYVLDSEIGRGGMGVVYKARQPSLARTVAVKVLPPQLAMDPEFVERFRQEAQTIAGLAHENIVHVYDIVEEENACFIRICARWSSRGGCRSRRPARSACPWRGPCTLPTSAGSCTATSRATTS